MASTLKSHTEVNGKCADCKLSLKWNNFFQAWVSKKFGTSVCRPR